MLTEAFPHCSLWTGKLEILIRTFAREFRVDYPQQLSCHKHKRIPNFKQRTWDYGSFLWLRTLHQEPEYFVRVSRIEPEDELFLITFEFKLTPSASFIFINLRSYFTSAPIIFLLLLLGSMVPSSAKLPLFTKSYILPARISSLLQVCSSEQIESRYPVYTRSFSLSGIAESHSILFERDRRLRLSKGKKIFLSRSISSW